MQNGLGFMMMMQNQGAAAAAQYETPPAYTNIDGQGDRTATVTPIVVATIPWVTYPASNDNTVLINGIIGAEGGYTGGDLVVGFMMGFYFGGRKVIIDEVTVYLLSGSASGNWKWMASDDGVGVNGVQVGAAMEVSGTSFVFTSLHGNTTGYKYYWQEGDSGSFAGDVWQEFKFRIANPL